MMMSKSSISDDDFSGKWEYRCHDAPPTVATTSDLLTSQISYEKVRVTLSSMSFECTRRNTTAKQPLFLPYSPYAVHSMLSQLSTYRLSTAEKKERKANRLGRTARTMNKPNEQRDQYILWSATTSAYVMLFLVVDFLEVV
jgi:hypothetical protein